MEEATVASNSQPKEVPQVEVTSRELGTLTELDPQFLDKAFEYRWVHKSQLKVARARARGYVIVDPNTEEIKNAVGDSPDAVDGTYTLGDVVLMKIKRLDFRARKINQKRRTDKRLKGPVRKFKRDTSAKRTRSGEAIEVITNKDPEQEE
jgi:hypothetical protein